MIKFQLLFSKSFLFYTEIFFIEKTFYKIQIDRIIEIAWEDRTPFEAIIFPFSISKLETIGITHGKMKPSSFRIWRERVQERATKHAKLRTI